MRTFRNSIIALALAASAWPGLASASEQAFYVITNKADGNSVVGFQASNNGRYKKIGEFKTGGLGTGDLEIPTLKKDETHPLANGDDPLISANAIAATKDRKFIVAVNPGDATISLMAKKRKNKLEMVNKVAATDKFPISLAVYKDWVVAASVGKDNNHGSIGLYQISGGQLKAVDGSRRDLKARPSTIAFSSDGEHVIVNELVTGKIKVFAVEGKTLSKAPVSMIDSPRSPQKRFHAIPVGFAVHGDGGMDIVLMSEARFLTPDFKLRQGKGEVVQTPLYSWQTGSLSSYQVSDDGQISLVSGDVKTGYAIEGGEIANCWVALSKDGSTLWAANALSSSISSFKISADGTAILKNVVAYKDKSEKLFFSDMAVSQDGKRLYQLVGNQGQVMIFNIDANGDLSLKQTVGGLPQIGAYGMLVL